MMRSDLNMFSYTLNIYFSLVNSIYFPVKKLVILYWFGFVVVVFTYSKFDYRNSELLLHF